MKTNGYLAQAETDDKQRTKNTHLKADLTNHKHQNNLIQSPLAKKKVVTETKVQEHKTAELLDLELIR